MHLSYTQKKYFRIAAFVLAALMLIILIAGTIAYSKRESILTSVVKKAQAKARRDYKLDLELINPHFEGLSTLAFSKVIIVPEGRDSLLRLEDLHIRVKLMPLLLGNIKLAGLKLGSGSVQLVKRDSLSNYDFLFKRKKSDPSEKSKANYAQLANRLLNQILYKIPDDMDLKNFELKILRDTSLLTFNLPSASIIDGELKSRVLVNKGEAVWHVDGTVDPSSQKLDFKLYAEGKKFELTALEQRYGLKLNFDTIYTSLKETRRSGSEFHIIGSWAVRNLLINHPKIAANDIVVPSGSIDADLLIGENYLAVDSSSTIHLKNIQAHPFVKVTMGPKKVYELKLNTDYMDAQQLFDAFPAGLFEALDGIKVEGKLKYNLDFALDTRMPDSVRFSSSLSPQGFRVLKWGKTNLQKINQPFVYTPYEYGKPMRNITIGPENPDFTPYDQISSNLKNAVLTAEDPSFFSHRGFVETSIRKSIATNFKEKAFKRGGSTISMQLVKNVFLNRQKTLARKIEEILMVWIIENNHVSEKRRMFEVYLNLIEWGRNVYGIGEASRYYFGKTPAELTLGESIYLASIVPRPKSGLYFFEPDGSVRTSLRGYFKLIGNLMASKGLTSRDTNAYGFYGVRLREGLRRQIAPPDTSLLDSLLEDTEDGDDPIFRQFIVPRRDTAGISEATRPKPAPADTVLSRSERRKLRREQRRLEREQKRQEGE